MYLKTETFISENEDQLLDIDNFHFNDIYQKEGCMAKLHYRIYNVL